MERSAAFHVRLFTYIVAIMVILGVASEAV